MSLSLLDLRDALRKGITKRIEAHSAHVAGGSIASFDEYKRATGRILGLREALDEIEELFRRLNDDE